MGKTDSLPAIILDSELRSQSGIIQPLGRNNIHIVAISSKKDCPAFHSKYVKHKFISPKIEKDENAYIDFLINLKFKGVLFYSNDVSAVVLSKNKAVLKEAGFLINIPDIDFLEKVFDKWKCYNISKSLGIPMPRSQQINNIDEIYRVWDGFKKPVILKGTRLAGGIYYKINERSEIPACWEKICNTVYADEYSARKSGIILQEYLTYPITDNWSCETLFDKYSQPVNFFTIKRIRTSLNTDGTYSSRLFAGYHEPCMDIQKKTERLLSAMQWKGFAHVEYFYVPERSLFFLTEVNPRLPGYSYYPCSTGFNMALYYYYDLINVPFIKQSSFPKSVYFETFHYPGDLTQGIVHVFKGHINFLSFLSSYLYLFQANLLKVIDPIRCDDLFFTFLTLIDYLKKLSSDSYNYIYRKMKKCLHLLKKVSL